MTSAGREKFWLDDLVAALTTILDKLQDHCINQKEVMRLVGDGLKFAWTGEAVIGSKKTDKWSVVRKDLQRQLVNVHHKASLPLDL